MAESEGEKKIIVEKCASCTFYYFSAGEVEFIYGLKWRRETQGSEEGRLGNDFQYLVT